MYKEDLALNNLQELICHKTKLNSFAVRFLLLKVTGICLSEIFANNSCSARVSVLSIFRFVAHISPLHGPQLHRN